MRNSRIRQVLGQAWLLALTSTACDEGGSDTRMGGVPDAGEHDAATSSDASTAVDDAGGDGDGPDGSVNVPADLSDRMACIANVRAQCDRRARCSYTENPVCTTAEQLCPDNSFSPGTTRDAASLYECAREWENFDCTAFAAGDVPACLTPGTREVGEACVFPNQCKTLSCSGSPGTCGQCLDRAPLGSACVSNRSCVMGAVCTEGICSPPEPVVPNGRQVLGHPCDNNLGGCVPGVRCAADPTSETEFRCTLLDVGDTCENDDCPLDKAYCENHVCVALPTLGQACASPSSDVYLRCAPTTYCDAGMCVARLPLGATCSIEEECLESSDCAEHTPQSEGKCLAFHEEGESCSGEFERCVLNTECVAGTCRAVASQGLFESACGS